MAIPDVAEAFSGIAAPTSCTAIAPKLIVWFAGTTEYCAPEPVATKPVCEGVKQAVIE